MSTTVDLVNGQAIAAEEMQELTSMMTYQRIGGYVTAEPFRPFRIQMTGGRTFEIRHPEMVQVGRTTMTIYTFMNNDPSEAKEQQIEVSLLLIESVEPLDAAVHSQGT